MNKEIDLNNLDKSGWQSFTFEQIANKISETVQPSEAVVDIYIGLEHIDPNDIHIRRKGNTSDVKGGKLRCYPGDIIFGKRRAYQRKAAIVDFDGICSAHAFVFRANQEVINPNFFPFFLHSDQFMHRMVDISVGGLSPTINWNDLKHEEFLLPPIALQAKFAKLLWALDESSEKNNALKHSLEICYLSLLNSIFGKNTPYTKLKEIKINYFKGLSANEDMTGESMLIPSGGVFPRFLKKEKIKKVNISNESYDKRIYQGDILFNTGGKGTLGRSHFFNISNGNFYCDSFVLVIRVNDDNFLNKYIYHIFQSNLILHQITKHTKGTTGITSIDNDAIKNFEIPILKIETQKQFVKRLDSIEKSIENLNHKIDKEKVLKNSIIKTIF